MCVHTHTNSKSKSIETASKLVAAWAWEGGVTVNRHETSLGDGSVLKLECGDDYITL